MKIIAVDVGGNKIDFGIVENNKIRKTIRIPTEADKGRDYIVKKIIELHHQSPSSHAYEIANSAGVHRAVVEKVRRKYGLKRTKFISAQE